MCGASAVLLVVLTVFNVNLVFDAFTALGLMIAFYYRITGFACAIYYRHQLGRSFRNAVFVGVLPVAGGIMLTWVLVDSLVQSSSRTRASQARSSASARRSRSRW